MTRQQQKVLVQLLLSKVGDIVEFEMHRDVEELAEISSCEIAAQLATWMAKLPGKAWDSRLPYPDNN